LHNQINELTDEKDSMAVNFEAAQRRNDELNQRLCDQQQQQSQPTNDDSIETINRLNNEKLAVDQELTNVRNLLHETSQMLDSVQSDNRRLVDWLIVFILKQSI
jgi:hypothetical protein